jgi:hypothetical protein
VVRRTPFAKKREEERLRGYEDRMCESRPCERHVWRLRRRRHVKLS